MIDLPQAVLVVLVLLALNLVVCLLNLVLLEAHRGSDKTDVAVHATANPALELIRRNLVHLGSTLRRVKIRRGKRQDHSVDWQEFHYRALLLFVKPQLEVLRPTQRQLGQHLLLLVAEFLDLLSNLPVQEVTLAL